MHSTHDDTNIQRTLATLNARAWGLAFGLVAGVGLFLATMILVVRGGDDPGRHLRLISAFFPGYSVSVAGSFIGFMYAFVVGYGIGRLIGGVYNRLAQR